jgi:hypothetical protein
VTDGDIYQWQEINLPYCWIGMPITIANSWQNQIHLLQVMHQHISLNGNFRAVSKKD